MDNKMLSEQLRLIADTLCSKYCRDVLIEAAKRLEEGETK